MPVLTAFNISLIAFAALQFILLPLIHSKLRSGTWRSGVAGSAALFGVLRTSFLVTGVTSGGLILLLRLVSNGGTVPLERIDRAVEQIQRLRSILTGLGAGLGGLVLCLAGLGLALYASRRARRRVDIAMAVVAEREFSEVLRAAQQGELEELPPTGKMLQLDELQVRLAATEESLSPDDDATRAVIQAKRNELRGLRTQIDIARRLQGRLEAAEVPFPAPRGIGQRLQVLLVSRGLFGSLGKVAQAAFLLAYVLMIPSLLGVLSPRTVEAPDSPIVQRLVDLENLRLIGSMELASRDWELARSALPEPTVELDAEDEATIDAFADALEMAFATSEVWNLDLQPTPTVAAAAFSIGAMGARDSILERSRQSSRGRAARAPALSRVEGVAASLSSGERRFLGVVEGLGDTVPTPRPTALREDLLRVARSRPGTVAKFRAALETFQMPLSPRGLQGQFARSSVRAIVGAADSAAAGMIGLAWEVHQAAALRDLASQHPPEEVLARAQNGEALKEFARAPEFNPAHHQMRTEVILPQNLDGLHTRLAEYPPTLDAHLGSPETQRLQTVATERYNRTVSRDGSGSPLAGTAPVSAYQDHFPGQAQAPLNTPRGRVVVASAERLIADSAARQAWKNNNFDTARAAKHSRNFGRLRLSARVGGVLIGREPEGDPDPLDIRAIDWEKDETGRVRLHLTDAAGQRFSSLWHQRNVMFHALAYAADGRATTVTMISADPLVELKILLHPTLLDTPMGQRAIRLDQLTDTYANGDYRLSAIAEFEGHMDLYRWCWATRILETDLAVIGAEAHAYRQHAQQLLDSVNRTSMSKAVLKAIPSSSILLMKSDYFDPTIVAVITRTLPAKSLGSFKESAGKLLHSADVGTEAAGLKGLTAGQLGDSSRLSGVPSLGSVQVGRRSLVQLERALDAAITEYKSAALSSTSRFDLILSIKEAEVRILQAEYTQRMRMFITPPEYQVWSGVREMPYSLDMESLLWDREDKLLDFILQVAFESEAKFGSDEAEVDSVEEPWAFPSIDRRLANDVRAALADPENIDDDRAVRDCEEFTSLQRLFRCALEGRLGQDFPLDRLVALAEFVEPEEMVPGIQTLRWNCREGSFETFGLLMLKNANAQGEVKSLLELAIALLGESVEAVDQLHVEIVALGLEHAWRSFDAGAVERAERWGAIFEKGEALHSGNRDTASLEALDKVLIVAATLLLREAMDVRAATHVLLTSGGLDPLPE